ncbi:ATP-binding protein [Agromyces larvae]|uniref:DNA binding domain-containing protein n=1 Tax=Agromyces larvae TaxID=2929802 RepID=A0ABY4BUN7_9MICO|nr:ATP-binding protein [Agromyces larvae]UOE42889.1 putative DNA binding domain-containing protein [Agromyces larvae]
MSTNETDRALAADIHVRGAELAALPEDQWFERKSARIGARELAQTLCAFANAEGGTIVVGLHNGVVEGMPADPKHVNALRQASLDFTSPPVRVRIDQVGCVNSRGEMSALLVFRVLPGETVHEMSNGDCYLRVGDESRRLGFAQRQELHYDRGPSQFDGAPVRGVSVSDLDASLLKQYRESAGFSGTNTQLLRNRGLVTPDDESVTTAGYLLFAPDPTERLPQAVVRVIRYRAPDRGTGAGLNVEAGHDVRIEGPIPRLITDARRVIEDWQPKRTALDGTGRFSEQPVVPPDAWLEGLVNAVVHRSYSLGGDHIRVEIFPDRIELTSPGRFPGLADPTAPLEVSRYARNPRIARVCTDLRLTRELGEGIRRMFDEMRSRGLTDPVYTQTAGSVKLTLSGVSRISDSIVARLPRGSLSTLNALRAARQPLGTGELQELLDVSRPTLIRQLNALREEGLVKWTGKSKQDPRAMWVVED